MSLPILSVKDLSFQYGTGKAPALKEISFEMQPGEFICITGASGAGKTTLALAISGIIPHLVHGQLSGAVLFRGKPMAELALSDIARSVGIILQDPESQLFNLTVFEEVTFGLQNLKFPPDQVRIRAEEALKAVGMFDYRDHSSAALSGGQKQRVAIACGLALGSQLLILDEPTSELDPIGSAQVYDILFQLNREGVSIVLIDQKLEEIATAVDRVLYLQEGRLVRDQEPKDFFESVLRGEFGERDIFVPQAAEFVSRIAPDQCNEPGLPLSEEEFLYWWQSTEARRKGAAS